MNWKLMGVLTVTLYMLFQGWRGAHARERTVDFSSAETAAAASAPESPVKVIPPQRGLDKFKIQKLIRGVYEVLIPKVEDEFVVYQRALPVEKLPFKERNDKYMGIGTAFSISQGKFVSAAHVFSVETKSLAKDYFLRNSEGRIFKINRFLRYSAYRDAVEFDVTPLEAPPGGKEFVHEVLPFHKKTELGDTVYTVGNAFGDGIAVRGGQIASFTPEDYDGLWQEIRYSAPASPGNSGGPLVNEEGQVVGIVVKKNGSENLNYALPIEELFKLPTNKSEFYIKQDQASYEELVVSKDWKFESPLPATLPQLAKAAEESRRQFRIALYDDFFRKYADELFPANERLKVYLREQSFSNYLSSIERNQQKNWYLDQPKYGETLLEENQKLILGYTKSGGSYFLLERPKDVPLAEFVQNGQLIHDTFLKAVKWNRSFAGEKILISSYGKPQETNWERDKLGRPWNVSIWRTAFNDRMHLLACTPVPKGVNCAYDTVANSTETLGFLTLQRMNRDELMFSYGGNLPYWKEFLSLEQRFLPSRFADNKLDYAPAQGIDAKVAGYQLKYQYPELSESSYLQVDAGFGSKDPYRHEVFSVRVLNRFDRSEGVGVWAKVSPLPLNSEEYKRDWQDLESRKGPYSGKPLDERGLKIVRHILQRADAATPSRAPASVAPESANEYPPVESPVAAKSERTYVLSCFEQPDSDKQDLAKKCLKWVQIPLAPGE